MNFKNKNVKRYFQPAKYKQHKNIGIEKLQVGNYQLKKRKETNQQTKYGYKPDSIIIKQSSQQQIASKSIIQMQPNSFSTLDEAILAMQGLVKKTKPAKSTSMKSVVAALYTADAEGELRYSNCIGLLTLDMDRELKTTMLRFYNMETVSLVFQIELYYGFINNYKMVTSTFYIFEYPRGIIGFLFKSKEDAEIMKVKISSASPKVQQYQQIKKKKLQEAQKKKKQGSFFNKIKGIFSDQPQQPQKHSGQVISVHKAIAFDLKTGKFNTNNIPPEWQQIFDSLKLSQEDLNDNQITNLIVQQTIMRQVKNQAQKNQDKVLQQKIKQAQQQQKQYIQAYRQTVRLNLPPPPPPPPLLLAPPQLADNRASMGSKRANLMQQIRNNKLQLKHVEKNTNTNAVNLDISNMNKQERLDHAERIRQKLQMRKKALNRREASDEQD